jgi:hypothetical protein
LSGQNYRKERDAKTPRSVHNYAAETVTRFGVRTVDGCRIGKPLTTAIHAKTMIGATNPEQVPSGAQNPSPAPNFPLASLEVIGKASSTRRSQPSWFSRQSFGPLASRG